MLSGTPAAIATPAVAPRIVAASHVHARRVDAPADPAMMTYAVHATSRLCSFPSALAMKPANSAATAACIARAIVGESARTAGWASELLCATAPALAGSATPGVRGNAAANAAACDVDWAT